MDRPKLVLHVHLGRAADPESGVGQSRAAPWGFGTRLGGRGRGFGVEFGLVQLRGIPPGILARRASESNRNPHLRFGLAWSPGRVRGVLSKQASDCLNRPEFGPWLTIPTEPVRSRSPCGVRTRDECTKRTRW